MRDCKSVPGKSIPDAQPLLGYPREVNEHRLSAETQPIRRVSTVPAGPHLTIQEPVRPREAERNPPSGQDNCILPLPSLLWQSTIASYSDWDETQRNEVGGTEYRALKTSLLSILIGYFVIFHLLGCVLLYLWILDTTYARAPRDIGIDESWWAITAGSAFNDLGFTLTPDSMASFNRAAFPLLVMTVLIVIGNTGFPCMLQLIIWLLSKVAEPDRIVRLKRDCGFFWSGLADALRSCFLGRRPVFAGSFDRYPSWLLLECRCVGGSEGFR